MLKSKMEATKTLTPLAPISSTSTRITVLVFSVFPGFNLCCRKRQKGYVSGPFNGQSEHSLMLGAIARDSSRYNFSPFAREDGKRLWLFVVDLQAWISTETADLVLNKHPVASTKNNQSALFDSSRSSPAWLFGSSSFSSVLTGISVGS